MDERAGLCCRRLVAGSLVLAAVACGARSGLRVDRKVPDAGEPDAPACEAGSLVPLPPARSRLLFLTDVSGSMAGERWQAARLAMGNFFGDPRTTGLSIGMTFFPAWDDCKLDSYLSPTVPIANLTADPAPIDAHEALLVKALAEKIPSGSTPLLRAFQGTLGYLETLSADAALGQREIVVVTDGHPGGCEEDELTKVTALATSAQSGPMKLVTHVIGIGQDIPFAGLSDLAAAGQGKAIFIDAGSQLETLLFDALVETTRSCAFWLPKGAGENLALAPTGAPVAQLKEVENANQCGDALAWYHDAAASGRIVLCPAACERTVDGAEVVRLCADSASF